MANAVQPGRTDVQRGIDEYVEYQRIVGDDDNGKTFTPSEYEAYIKKMTPIRTKNRIYVSFTNPETGMDCKLVGPQTLCACGHRYINHKTDFAKLPNPIVTPCRKCACDNYHYVPKNGTQPIRCATCKHFTDEHGLKYPYPCTKCGKGNCAQFKGSFTCGCGQPVHKHIMIKETKEERIKRGHPVGQDVIYQAMGGLTGFSSLAEGYERYDPSGAGAPSSFDPNAPISPGDHAFLKMHASSVDKNREETQQLQRREGESELDYYERLYQWKVKHGKFR